MIQDIKKQLDLIEQSLSWADKYKISSFPKSILKDYRRRLKKIEFALEENCSAAAYGESQVGKSYLMSSLLSSSSEPFYITDGGKNYNFIKEINPSGHNVAKEESTGVITRFTAKCSNPKMKNYVKICNLSVTDIILLIADSYYKDVKINAEKALQYDQINNELSNLKIDNTFTQYYITDDDILDIQEYFKNIIGNNAASVINSDFCKEVSSCISHIREDSWIDVFSLLWNKNEALNTLFKTLIDGYKLLKFSQEVYVPFDAVLNENGSLLKISLLDVVCGKAEGNEEGSNLTSVYDKDGNLLINNYSKAMLAALTAELTFLVPDETIKERKFLSYIDLLDFPGARRRESIQEENIDNQLPIVLRRGKVAYLLNKYSRSLRISSLLFCHHADMNGHSEIGETLNDWISANVGNTPEQRTEYISNTNYVSPFFFIATKFNYELKWTDEVQGKKEDLEKRWDIRFKTTLSNEVVKTSTYTWFNNWIVPKPSTRLKSKSFQSIYLLRDFFWSRDQQVFNGYQEGKSGETSENKPEKYPDYREDLKNSFINYPFVREHFSNPEESWNSAATLNNDGSKVIIDDLNLLAPCLNEARRKKYMDELENIKTDMVSRLEAFFVPGDPQAKIENAKKISGDIRLSLDTSFGRNPEIFGNIINEFMVQSYNLRKIAYDIIIRHTDVPKDMSEINNIRIMVGIKKADNKEECIKKLSSYYGKSEEELKTFFEGAGMTLNDVIENDRDIPTTETDVVTKHILDYWYEHLNASAKALDGVLPHSDRISFMVQVLSKKVGMKELLSQNIDNYIKTFDKELVPNAVADSCSLILNNFISTVGWDYLKDEDKKGIDKIAKTCNVIIEDNKVIKPRSLETVLVAFDKSLDLIRNPDGDANIKETLRQLPLWDNFIRWENLIVTGILFTSDITDCNPEANQSIQDIIEGCKTLYN